MAVAGIEKNYPKDFLVQKLHVGAGFIDRFRVVELRRERVLGFSYGKDARRSCNSLGFASREKLTQFLERSARQSCEGAKVTDQGESNGFFANKQGQVFHAGQRGRTVAGEFLGDCEAER